MRERERERLCRRMPRWQGGVIIALVVSIIAGGSVRCGYADPSDPVAALIARSRTALGPELAKVKSLHFAGTISAGSINGTTEAWVDLADGRFAAITDAGPLTSGYGYDGRTGWRSDSKGIVLPQNGPMAKAVIATELFDNTYALYTTGYGGASVTYLGIRSDGGKNYEALTVTPKGGYAEEMWFDTATALPAHQIVDFGTGPITTNLAGYHSVSGLMVPSEQKITEQSVLKDPYGHKLRYTSIETTYEYNRTEVNVAAIDKHLMIPPPPPSDVSLPGGETRIPFTMRNFWITVEVRLNGKGPFEMMLDSGGRNILGPSVAWEAGAQDTGEIPQTGNVPMLKPMRYARAETMELGGATLKQQDFTVRGVGNIFTRDGMIGDEVFERFITTIDYVNRQIILRLPSSESSHAPTQANGEAELPLVFDDTKPGTECTVADTDATCIADTGSALPLILSGPFTKANPTVQPPWYAGAYGGVTTGSSGSEVREGPVSTFQIGPFLMANVNTMFTTAGNGALAYYPSVLVGNPIWWQFDLTFDYGRQVLRLKPNSNFKK